ncbi:uncharacterized protein NFIA_003210 [Aspergillus fischeri NRRL 181]|uniref:DJ-1/PfpI domain-containing protein n=1 Tax=Neosartorya fischeri (strain ATCC 1020 / DSM 3700 / CBS 544.65 / FGSC A1164 / JCM 1740 / NRRL 181 / WB 181) TaxID=331117 RepID=A1DJS8_NEOFI|nr:uncharacterized protein NFIA_003210 [Aspergillus fischeri NRRL 181]EAW16967.1 hypothetical protein NFIA_003210 [Aspergillus fischeri NRRL 181]
MPETIQPIKVCILSFEKMDLVDFAGPLETLSHVRGPSGDRLFSITVAGPSGEITTLQDLIIKRNISFEQATSSLAQFDVLIVPGASYLVTKELCILAGRRATTHYTIIPELAELCAKYGQTEIVRKRFVDAGLLDNGVRVVSSGGISSGFDAALYVVEVFCGLLCAEKASDVLDYQWRRSEGLF